MGTVESIFIDTAESVEEVAGWLTELFGLEPIPEQSGRQDEIGLRGRAATVDGWLGFLVEPNRHAEIDPAPDEVQAIDPYQIEVDIWYGGPDRGTSSSGRSGSSSTKLVEDRSDIAILLCHEVTILIAAYRPDRGRTTSNPVRPSTPPTSKPGAHGSSAPELRQLRDPSRRSSDVHQRPPTSISGTRGSSVDGGHSDVHR